MLKDFCPLCSTNIPHVKIVFLRYVNEYQECISIPIVSGKRDIFSSKYDYYLINTDIVPLFRVYQKQLKEFVGNLCAYIMQSTIK